MTQINSADQIEIQEIVFESPRGTAPMYLYGAGVSNTPVSEINIYENITLPYLTGNIVLLDDNALEDQANLLGSEKITIIIKSPYDNTTPIEKVFYVAGVRDSIKAGENSSLLVLDLIEDVGYFDKLTTASRSYEGHGEKIIEQILRSNFDKPINTFSMAESHQSPFRYIVPYKPAFHSINKVLAKITTPLGLPYFCYRTLTSDSFFISDLESIFKKGAFNEGKPFVLSQGNVATSDFTKQALSIYSMDNIGVMEDTLKIIQKGGVGSMLSVLNVNKGIRTETPVFALEVVKQLVAENVLSSEYEVELIDRFFKPDPSERDPRTVDQYPARSFSTISSSPYPLSGFNGYNEETYEGQHVLSVIRHAVLMLLQKNLYSIHVPGISFLSNESPATVGNLIELKIPANSIPTTQSSQAEMIDTKKSGNFLIMSKRHIIDVSDRVPSHTVSMELGRISSLEKVS